jgi:hypothetical protein
MSTYEEELTTDYPVFEPEPESVDVSASEETGEADTRVDLSIKILRQMHESMGHVIEMLEGGQEHGLAELAGLVTSKNQFAKKVEEVSGVRVLEGMFDGQGMVGPDGNVYTVPPNYASKSRLVEGDVMKLTIRPDGTFIYKQIGPVERVRLVGDLAFDAALNSYVILSEGKRYRILTASATYFKGEPGDQVTAFIPKSGKCLWAAVENIIKK